MEWYPIPTQRFMRPFLFVMILGAAASQREMLG
jgi:hypothetical protein